MRNTAEDPRERFLHRTLPVLAIALAAVLSITPRPASGQDLGWIITTDYSTFGGIRSFQTVAPWTVSADLAAIPGDAVGRHHQGRVYILGRTANILQVYDPAAGFALVREFSLGAGRNPQDIAFAADGTAYVSCYDTAELLQIDPETGLVTDVFSTAGFADADGLPETAYMVCVGDRLYIAAQLLDSFNWYAPTGPGALLVFDTAIGEWVDHDPSQPGIQPIALTGANPYTDLQVFGVGSAVHARIGCVGWFGLSDGGIEEVDLTAGSSLGWLATEDQLGGDVTRFLSRGDDIYALVSDAAFDTSVRHWDAASGALAVWDSGAGYVHVDLACGPQGQLFVADRTLGASGLRVFDTATGGELTADPVPTGLAPFLFVMPDLGGFAPAPELPRAGLALGRPYPNPGNPLIHVPVLAAPGSRVRLQICDLKGRRIISAELQADGQGRAQLAFTGADDEGRPVSSGVYRVIAEQGSQTAATTLTLVR